MAVCRWCASEMTEAVSCGVEALHLDGKSIAMIRWGEEEGWTADHRCGDCGVLPGGFHHLGCDVQQCPRCRGQMITCGCRFNEDGPDYDDDETLILERYVDSNGGPTERRVMGGQEVIVHYDDIPDGDRTTIGGIPVTTALRTVIDLAPDLGRADLEGMVADCLRRGLFTVDQARARIAAPDMAHRPGALLLGDVIGP